MINQITRKFSIVLGLATLMAVGCTVNSTDIVKKSQSNNDIIKYGNSRKYVKGGITVVYLTGTPYEIGFAHGKLCKREINEANKPFFDSYNRLLEKSSDRWRQISNRLKKHIPQEYHEEMRGISDGSEIEFDKILFLNMLTTISEGNRCFAFSFRENNSKIITVRQIDNDAKSHMYKNMLLYIIKPQAGLGFAAILNPG
jgi:hypothetical protein